MVMIPMLVDGGDTEPGVPSSSQPSLLWHACGTQLKSVFAKETRRSQYAHHPLLEIHEFHLSEGYVLNRTRTTLDSFDEHEDS
ncbi:hypothetical protein MUK42_27677 [Musa troglodytarum]|uniref:Uncharacterized protein n=1 Tax=Musa troglodytarum TaxID=320322 RepID=A0A9E7FDV3_9LILI|nr:hypothetical protein MUK42_27677 [Musa troglodytarum]